MSQPVSLPLLRVAKPGRYTGGELNAVTKEIKLDVTRFAFCFPDSYEVGMSNLGLQIIYFLLNRREDTYCERVFMPWPDMAELLKETDTPLFALETGDSLSRFDFLGFTLQYEMTYTNILAMLALAGIPLRSADRKEEDPLVCAGGPCACNPEPMADFFDFFYIGDAEAYLNEIMERYRKHRDAGGKRRDFLEKITDLPGVYVPAFYMVEYSEDGAIQSFTPKHPAAPAAVRRAIAPLDYFPETLIVPLIETIHDRVVLEIFRGCIRGCRFCQAGFIYRPVRERSADELIARGTALLEDTGHEEISLVSLSACDHSQFEVLVDGLLERTKDRHINISLPSLRLDAVSISAMKKTQAVRKSSLTFAPEAGSQRMRDIINKNLSENEILDGCFKAFQAGFDKIKLYFMAGLPFETEEDLLGIAKLTEQITAQYYRLDVEQRKRPVSVSVSCSCFIPKPFTPFQWAVMENPEDFAAKQKIIKNKIRKKQINYRYHDAKTALIEGILARGDRRLSNVIEGAFRLGAVFDGWTEFFNFGLWQKAFEQAGLYMGFYSREKDLQEILPWDFIDMGVSKDFLKSEWEKAQNGLTTPNCREACAGCGLDC